MKKSVESAQYAASERDYVENEAKQRVVVKSITQAIQDLVCSITDDEQELDRCDQICAAIDALFAVGHAQPLVPHDAARTAWMAAHREEAS